MLNMNQTFQLIQRFSTSAPSLREFECSWTLEAFLNSSLCKQCWVHFSNGFYGSHFNCFTNHKIIFYHSALKSEYFLSIAKNSWFPCTMKFFFCFPFYMQLQKQQQQIGTQKNKNCSYEPWYFVAFTSLVFFFLDVIFFCIFVVLFF